jgi:hypothetical protein
MRRAGRTDANHSAITTALLKLGASVDSLASMGKGYPDLLVGFRGRALLLEVKDGSKPPSHRKLTADEQRWFTRFRGEAYVVNSVQEALDAVLQPSASTVEQQLRGRRG